MALIEWKSDLSVGIDSIDAQHKCLVRMLNDLHTASDEGQGAAVIGKTLAEIASYIVEHFEYEESLFALTCYAGAEKHKAAHEELMNSFSKIREKFEAGSADGLSRETLEFLVNWLLNHTMRSDKEYSAYRMKYDEKAKRRTLDPFFMDYDFTGARAVEKFTKPSLEQKDDVFLHLDKGTIHLGKPLPIAPHVFAARKNPFKRQRSRDQRSVAERLDAARFCDAAGDRS